MYYLLRTELGLTWWLSGKESACQCRRCRRCGFDTQVRKIPWRRKWQPTPIFLPGKSLQRGAWQATVHGVTESDMTAPHTRGENRGYRKAASHFIDERPGRTQKVTWEDELAKILSNKNCIRKTGGWEEGAIIGIEPKRRQESKIRQQMSKGSLEKD